MDKKIVTISIIVACSFAFIVGYQGGKTSLEDKMTFLEDEKMELEMKLKDSSEDVFRLKLAQEKLSTFTEKELKELRDLKDKKSQFKKIDEMMGKMMLMLLADLGIKISKDNRQYLREKTFKDIPEEEVVKENFKSDEEKPQQYDDFVTGELEVLGEDMTFPPHMTGPQIENIKKNLRTKAKRFQAFSDVFKGHVKNSLVSSRQKKLLYTTRYLQNDLKGAPKHLVQYYEKFWRGEFRRGLNSKAKLNFKLKYTEEKHKEFPVVQFEFKADNKKGTYISINEKYLAMHPKDHSNDGKGPCRFLILRQINGTGEFFLSYTKDKQKVFGKMLAFKKDKNIPVGYFVLD